MKLGTYRAIGCAVELLSNSTYHGGLPMAMYMNTEIYPPIIHRQCCFYFDEFGKPVALVTWAWLSAEIEREVLKSGRQLSQDDWCSGNNLFFNDWICPYKNVRSVVNDMRQNIFPDQIASSVRRNPDGTVRKVNRWIGSLVKPSSLSCASEDVVID